MPLHLTEASEVLKELTNKRSYVKRFQNHIEAWFFELTENPNIFYQTVMRYDGKELTVTKAHKVRVDKPRLLDITDTSADSSFGRAVRPSQKSPRTSKSPDF